MRSWPRPTVDAAEVREVRRPPRRRAAGRALLTARREWARHGGASTGSSWAAFGPCHLSLRVREVRNLRDFRTQNPRKLRLVIPCREGFPGSSPAEGFRRFAGTKRQSQCGGSRPSCHEGNHARVRFPPSPLTSQTAQKREFGPYAGRTEFPRCEGARTNSRDLRAREGCWGANGEQAAPHTRAVLPNHHRQRDPDSDPAKRSPRNRTPRPLLPDARANAARGTGCRPGDPSLFSYA